MKLQLRYRLQPIFDLAIEARWLWQQIPKWVQAATHRTER